LKKRIHSFLKKIEDNKFQKIAICTHGAIIAALKHQLLENNFTLDDLHDYPEPGVLLVVKGKKIQQIDFTK
jgi:hypothetical protein